MIVKDEREEDLPVDDYDDTFSHVSNSTDINTGSPSHGSYDEHANYLS